MTSLGAPTERGQLRGRCLTPRNYEADAWELYCLSDDRSEAKNVIKAHPKIAAALSKKIRAWLTQKDPTWKPKYPIEKESGKPAGPPPLL